MSILTPTELESRRFGMKVFRVETRELDAEALLAETLASGADLVILRLPAGSQAQLNRLERVGLPFLVADTLVYYFADLDKVEPAAPRNRDVEFVPVGPAGYDRLDRLVGTIFSDYANHYASNPYLPKSVLVDGYREWARGLASRESGGRAWIACHAGEDVGFCACSEQRDRGVLVLNGIVASAAGRGFYTDMVRFTLGRFKEAGLREMEVSTQVQNFAVQKVWAREGLTMKEARTTVHVNAFLSHTRRPTEQLAFVASPEDVAAWRAARGDREAVRSSDEAARPRDVFPTVAYGLLPLAQLARHFGSVFPGPGTSFRGLRVTFLRPLVAGGQYRISIRYPLIDEERGLIHACVDVRDGDGAHCLLAYCDLQRQ